MTKRKKRRRRRRKKKEKRKRKKELRCLRSFRYLLAIVEIVLGFGVAVLNVDVGTVLVVVQVELLVVGVVDVIAATVAILEVALCGPEVVLDSRLRGCVVSGSLSLIFFNYWIIFFFKSVVS